MMPFDLVEPGSLGEALALLDPGDPSVRPLAGGTALMLLMKSGLFRPKRMVSLRAAGERLSGSRAEAMAACASARWCGFRCLNARRRFTGAFA